MTRLRIVVLASGRGSNCEAIFRATQTGQIAGTLVGIITNRADAGVLEKAKAWGVPTMTLLRRTFATREVFDEALLEEVNRLEPGLIVLAGYMLKLGDAFMDGVTAPIMNIHPSLLPKFPGLHAQRQALEAGEKETGCTVHWVDKGLDTGPVLAQRRIPILMDDTEDVLCDRLLPVEHALYVDTIAQWIANPERYPTPVTGCAQQGRSSVHHK